MNFSTLLSFRIRPKPKRWQQCPGCNNWRVLLMLRGGVVVWCDDLVTVRWVPSTGSSYSCPTTPTYPTVALQPPDKQHTPTHHHLHVWQIRLFCWPSPLFWQEFMSIELFVKLLKPKKMRFLGNQIYKSDDCPYLQKRKNNWNLKPSIRGFNGNASPTTCFHNCTLVLDWKVIF